MLTICGLSTVSLLRSLRPNSSYFFNFRHIECQLQTTPPPQTKRHRTSSTSQDAPLGASTVKPSCRFWYADGNVVLQAEDTQFRVHRLLLSLHSEIMKGCFDCPQPVDNELVEGCPVIHLTDSAKDIDILCGLLYGVYQWVFPFSKLCSSLTHCFFLLFYTSTDDDIIDFDYLTAMIRLGRKYDFSRFKNKALKYIKQLFPRNLKEWLAVHNDNSLLTEIIDSSEGFLLHVINLAYENDIPSILPAAIICLCMRHDLVCLNELKVTTIHLMRCWLYSVKLLWVLSIPMVKLWWLCSRRHYPHASSAELLLQPPGLWACGNRFYFQMAR